MIIILCNVFQKETNKKRADINVLCDTFETKFKLFPPDYHVVKLIQKKITEIIGNINHILS